MTERRLTRQTMWSPLLDSVPAFQPRRDAFLADWEPDGEPLPEFICIRDLTDFTIDAFVREDFISVEKVMAVVETWLLNGDDDVTDLAFIGFLEDLSNWAMHNATKPDDFARFMPEKTKQAFDAIKAAWASLNDE